MTKTKYHVAAFEAMALYLLTGAACILVGSSMSYLMVHFDASLTQIAAIQSAYALGRMSTVFITGWVTERFGVKRTLLIGVSLLFTFLTGVPLTHSYPVGLLMAFLGGVGMGSQDTACPVILSAVYPESYASMLSAGQALFGAGCFLPPLIMSVSIALELPFYTGYYVFGGLALVMLLALPFVRLPEMKQLSSDGGHVAHKMHLRCRWLGIMVFIIVVFAYSAVVNTINLYTATFSEGLSLPPVIAANLLTIFNLSSMLGSLCFSVILKKVRPIFVLLTNSVVAIAALTVSVILQSALAFFVGLSVAGFVLGVLFSVIVTLATGLYPAHASMAAAGVAVVSGASDTVNPLITGRLFTHFGMGMVYPYTIMVLMITLLAGISFHSITKPVKSSSLSYKK